MRLLLAIVAVVTTVSGVVQPDFHLGYRVEPGVEKRVFAGPGGRVMVNSWLVLDGGIYGDIRENSWLGYAISGEFGLPAASDLNLRLGFQHEEWADWRCGENRVFLFYRLIELGRLSVGAGVAWRQPVFDSTRFQIPWLISGSVGEWNLLYQVKWTVWQRGNTELGFFLTNINRHQIFNPQVFPFGVLAGYQLAPYWRVSGFCATAVKGLSAALFSLSPLEVCLGVSYEK